MNSPGWRFRYPNGQEVVQSTLVPFHTMRVPLRAGLNLRGERLMFPKVGLAELMVILAIVVIIFGANRLPQLGRGIGSAIRNFKDGIKDDTADHKS